MTSPPCIRLSVADPATEAERRTVAAWIVKRRAGLLVSGHERAWGMARRHGGRSGAGGEPATLESPPVRPAPGVRWLRRRQVAGLRARGEPDRGGPLLG